MLFGCGSFGTTVKPLNRGVWRLPSRAKVDFEGDMISKLGYAHLKCSRAANTLQHMNDPVSIQNTHARETLEIPGKTNLPNDKLST